MVKRYEDSDDDIVDDDIDNIDNKVPTYIPFAERIKQNIGNIITCFLFCLGIVLVFGSVGWQCHNNYERIKQHKALCAPNHYYAEQKVVDDLYKIICIDNNGYEYNYIYQVNK